MPTKISLSEWLFAQIKNISESKEKQEKPSDKKHIGG
jgi:hypothetical protein